MANLHLCGCRPEAEDGRFPDLCPEHGRMKVSDAAAEITRLRSELDRAAVRENRMAQLLREAREAISTLPPEALGTGYASDGEPYSLRDELIYYITGAMADLSPLAEAAQEVLEAAIKETEAEERDEKPAWIVRLRDDRADAVDRYCALLEGRGEG